MSKPESKRFYLGDDLLTVHDRVEDGFHEFQAMTGWDATKAVVALNMVNALNQHQAGSSDNSKPKYRVYEYDGSFGLYGGDGKRCEEVFHSYKDLSEHLLGRLNASTDVSEQAGSISISREVGEYLFGQMHGGQSVYSDHDMASKVLGELSTALEDPS